MNEEVAIREGAITTGGAVILHIELAASADKVFRALTDPAELVQWWGPEQHCITEHWRFDLRPGGSWEARGRDDACGDWTVSGRILEFDPPRLLAYTWNEVLEHPRPELLRETVVRYELEATPRGTHLVLTHSGFGPQEAARRDYASGWPGIVASLGHWAASRAAPAIVTGPHGGTEQPMGREQPT